RGEQPPGRPFRRTERDGGPWSATVRRTAHTRASTCDQSTVRVTDSRCLPAGMTVTVGCQERQRTTRPHTRLHQPGPVEPVRLAPRLDLVLPPTPRPNRPPLGEVTGPQLRRTLTRPHEVGGRGHTAPQPLR